MLNEIIESCRQVHRLETIYDATFGRGGHSRALLESFDGASLVATDQDLEAVETAKEMERGYPGRFRIVHSNFIDFLEKSEERFDFILADLGVSSPQLDDAERGFSFYRSGPLDMRMNQESKMTAADIVNQWDAPDLVDLFRSYGEVRSPQRVVRAVVNDRKERPFTDTTQLSSLIERVDGWRKKGAHPATKYFLALRLKVNRELEVIQESLPFFVSNLKPDGRLAILTFHSLEDRIVKHGMRQLGVDAVNKKVIVASREEQKDNVRSRSAKLRVYRKAHQADD